MRDYGKVSPQFWIGETGKLLRGNADAQVLALYLMTNPHATMTGVYHCPIIYMSHETGLSLEAASKGLARLIEVGFCEYDEASESVFVVNMAAYQIDDCLKPEDKRVLGLQKEVTKMLPARFQHRFVEVYGSRFHLTKQGENNSPLQAPYKPLPSQEQEQEQEQEEKHTAPSVLPSGKRKASAVFPDDIPLELQADFLTLRKAKKSPLTQTALDGIAREAAKAGVSLRQALETCCERGWQGFKAEWVATTQGQKAGDGWKENPLFAGMVVTP